MRIHTGHPAACRLWVSSHHITAFQVMLHQALGSQGKHLYCLFSRLHRKGLLTPSTLHGSPGWRTGVSISRFSFLLWGAAVTSGGHGTWTAVSFPEAPYTETFVWILAFSASCSLDFFCPTLAFGALVQKLGPAKGDSPLHLLPLSLLEEFRLASLIVLTLTWAKTWCSSCVLESSRGSAWGATGMADNSDPWMPADPLGLSSTNLEEGATNLSQTSNRLGQGAATFFWFLCCRFV